MTDDVAKVLATRADLRAPFPYFGGKRSVAPLIWRAFGRVSNYVEPFFGSGAVLLERPASTWPSPDGPGTETVNDRSRFLANFWRALAADPDAVARWADWPVNETDLHARHRWLVAQLAEDFAAKMDADPSFYDAKIAGWWCWGACCWIGTGWCDEARTAAPSVQLPHLGNAGRSLHRKLGTGWCDEARTAAPSVQLPHLGDAGRGLHRKLPHLGDAGRGLRAYLRGLSERLRGVRVACGDWSRVCGDSVTWRHGDTAVLLDPPYAEGFQQYAAGGTGTGLSADVRAWAIEAGKHPRMRVVLCGLEGEHEMPSTWRCVAWKARGGYGSTGAEKNVNRHRERLWLSPACLDVSDRQRDLFTAAGAP